MSITQAVAAIGRFGFTGNVTPKIWYKRILTSSGKADFKAITLLSDILYWYRPTEIRDEATGQVVEYRKKFSADKLQRSYEKFAEGFGMTKREVREALVRLRDAGLITLEFRTVKIMGQLVANVLYVEPVAHEVEHITFSDLEEMTSKGQVEEYAVESDITPTDVRRVTSKRNTPRHENVIGDTANRHTNTEITTKTTTEITSINNLSDSGESNEQVNQSIGLCSLPAIGRMTNQNYLKSRFDEFYDAYGKKVNRAGAEKAFSKIKLPTLSPQVREEYVSSIIDIAKRWGELFQTAPSDQKTYQPHPASWINGKRWEDEALPALRQHLPVGSAPVMGSARDQVNDSLTDIHNTDW